MVKTPLSFTTFAVSNKAFTHQMIGQQLVTWLGIELNCNIAGYYKYHKLTIYSTDSHLNHTIFVRKQQLIEHLIHQTKERFGRTIVIKDIYFRAQSNPSSNDARSESEIDINIDHNHYDGEDLPYPTQDGSTS